MPMQTLPNLIDAVQFDLSRFVDWSSSFPDPYSDPVAAADQGAIGFTHLPCSLQAGLNEFAQTPCQGALLVTGLPLCADLPPTPINPFRQAGLQRIGSEALLFSISSSFGHPYSYREWEGGLLLHNKYPIRQHATIQLGSNSVSLQMHTEKAFRDISPDYVSLLCLRGDPDNRATTYLCDLRRAIGTLPPGAEKLLRMPLYAFKTDNPHLVKDGVGCTAPHPIVEERNGRMICGYVDDLLALSEEAEHVVNALRRAIGEAAVEVRLNAGDLLIMDNSHLVHGRSAYQPKYDGRDRWLQRLLISNRLDIGQLRSTGHLISDSCLSECSSEYRMVLDSQLTGNAEKMHG
ncbi:TauD/TfdA family dioxygenase [Bradyrhizobium genosp. P]|uniref:TauD/TfdA family dioxygenase n=1 Tax=Bradyrhizobium genosp. P TaxID=83641 RepID=UPI003CF46645